LTKQKQFHVPVFQSVLKPTYINVEFQKSPEGVWGGVTPHTYLWTLHYIIMWLG